MQTAIDVQHLSKSFVSQSGNKKIIKALDDVTLSVREGEVLGILGPNGAGKTTLLNILSTLLTADEGTVDILGMRSNPRNFYQLRTLLNMSSGYPNFPWSLTVRENLKFYGRLYGLPALVLHKRIDKLIEMLGLGDFADVRFDELSSGNKQKLSLAKALLNDPKIIFLDEPTVGLDPDVAIQMRRIITDVLKRSKATILLTTHNMQEAELMCERIVFIKKGKLIKLASPQELKQQEGKKDLEEVFVELARKTETNAQRPEVREQKKFIETQKAEYFAEETPFIRISKWFGRCFAFTYRNFIFAKRNIFMLMELLFWPMVTLLSIGLLGNYLELQEKALAFIMTGAITAGVLQVAQLDVAYSLLYEVWSKSVKHTFLTPIGVSENLFGSWVIGMLRGLIIFFILGLSALGLFGFRFPSVGVSLIFLFGIFGCALLLGLLVSVLILSFGQKAEITAWMFAYVFMLLCGIYYPINTLPVFFYTLAKYIPLTYFLEYFRQSFGFEPVLTGLLWKGFGLIILYLAAGLSLMNAAFAEARKKGVIVRLSE